MTTKTTNMTLVGGEHKADRAHVRVVQPGEEEQQRKETDVRHGMDEIGMDEIGMIVTNSPRLLQTKMVTQIPDLQGQNQKRNDGIQQSQAPHTAGVVATAAADQTTESDQHIGDEIESGRGGDFGIPCSESAFAVGLGLTDVEDLVQVGIRYGMVELIEPCCVKKRDEHEKQ